MSDSLKALRYAEPLASAETRIVAALPGICDGPIARAREGGTGAAVYLCNRIMRRAAAVNAAPADDRGPTYSEDAIRLGRDGRASGRVPPIIIPDSDSRPSGALDEV